jgi:hypothetical protein
MPAREERLAMTTNLDRVISVLRTEVRNSVYSYFSPVRAVVRDVTKAVSASGKTETHLTSSYRSMKNR